MHNLDTLAVTLDSARVVLLTLGKDLEITRKFKLMLIGNNKYGKNSVLKLLHVRNSQVCWCR